MSQPTHTCRACNADISHRAGQARFCDASCRDKSRRTRDPHRASRYRENWSEEQWEAHRSKKRAYAWAPSTDEGKRKRKESSSRYAAANRDRINARERARWAANPPPSRKKPIYGRVCGYRLCENPVDPMRRPGAKFCSPPCSQRECSIVWGEKNPDRKADAERRSRLSNRLNRAINQINREQRKRQGATSIPADKLRERFAYWGYSCWMCGAPWEQIEHVKPVSKGGPHILANLRPSCADCNRRKGSTWYGPARVHLFHR